MSKNLTPFFATETDLTAVLDAVGSIRPLQFICVGLSDSESVQSHVRLPKTDPVTNYLIADRALAIQVRDVPQRDGGHKFAIDQVNNPRTIALRPGGMIEAGYLIAGQVGTVSEDRMSVDLYKAVVSEMRSRFITVKSYLVGKEALDLLQSGVRLAATPKSSPTYDLTLPSPLLRR